MIPITLADLAAAVGGRLDGGAAARSSVTGPVVVDSRQVRAGGLFAALPGEHADGHDFAAAALAAGAVAVLAARPVGGAAVLVGDPLAALARLARSVLARLPELDVVAVTGSSGKTGTKDLLAVVLAEAGSTVAPYGSFNNELGVPLTALRCDPQTRFLIAEMGAREPGNIRYLCEVTLPRIGVVLNVGAAHAGVFGSRAVAAATKAELVEALPADGVAVLNIDQPVVAAMAGRTAARVVGVGRGAGAQVAARDVRLDDAARPCFELVTPEGSAGVRLRLHGEHHVGNALAAAAVGREAGLDVGTVAAALSAAAVASRWRMEVRERPDGVRVVNDAYNANPDSVAAALRALAAIRGSGRSWAVLGEMLELGADSAAEHAAAGALATRLGIDRVLAVGPGAAGVAAGVSRQDGSTLAERVADPGAAVRLLREQVRPGDVVLVKASRSIGLDRVAEQLLGEQLLAEEPPLPEAAR